MCDCSEEYNVNEIPVGPPGPPGIQGPTGPQGATPTLSSQSSTSLTVTTAPKTLTVDAGVAWTTAQRLRIANVDSTKVMEGPIVSYTSTTLVVNVDYIEGTGSDNAWYVSIVGSRGATGATGAAGPAGTAGATGNNAYTTITDATVSLGGNLYKLTVGSSAWMSQEQWLFIKQAGNYKVTTVPSSTEVIVQDLGTSGNVPANLIVGKTVSPNGVPGTNGTNGVNGFNYETLDGNNVPAEATGSYQFLMRNSTDTGYTWITGTDLKAYLASLP